MYGLGFSVLLKKGLSPLSIERIRRYYEDSITVPIVNCIPGSKVKNKRLTLRQGDCPSSLWFGYAIDPLLTYLNRRLSGIPLISKPSFGPQRNNSKNKIPPIEAKFKLIGYCDDVKPAIAKKKSLKLLIGQLHFLKKQVDAKYIETPSQKNAKFYY